MSFEQQRDTIITLIVTALYHVNDKETVQFIDNTVQTLCDLWQVGENIFPEEEERLLYIISTLPHEILRYLQ